MTRDNRLLTTHMMTQIAAGTATKLGDEFNRALVETLHRVMNVSLAILTRGEGYPAHAAQTLYCWQDGKPAENFRYDLDGTPCTLVYAGERITIPCDLGKKFPKERGFEGYCGVPLRNRHKSVVGHLAVLSREPFDDTDNCETILRIFGSRAEAELQRADADVEREALIQSLQRTRDRLQLQREAARAANSFKSDLVAITVHDLRNPLTAIISRADLVTTYLTGTVSLSQEDRLKKATQCADDIVTNSERMEKMISGILESSRANATQVSHTPSLFDLSHTLATVVSLNQDAAATKSIHIDLSVPVGLKLFADEDRLIEAIDNLVANAIKFSPEGSGVFLSVYVTEDDVSFTVRDQGQGLAAGDVHNIFERFQGASAKPTGSEASFGLGLWIVKEIADNHGGHVTATSDGPGLGAAFTLTLPIIGE